MGLHIRRGFFAKYSKHITAAVAIFALVAQPMYGLVASQVANALTATVTTQQELKDAVAGTGAYAGTSTVVIDGTINTTEEIRVTRSLAIQGGAIHATFNLNGQNNSVIEADATMANTVTISGTTISSNKSADLHGVNAYVTNVELNDVTINNSGRAAINVNGATVTTSNLSTAGNGKTNFLGVSYGVIDLAKGSGVTATPTLNVNGLMTHAENLLHVRYAVSGYSVTGTQAGQYYAASQALSNGLRLKAAPNTPVITAPTSPVTDSNDVTVKWNAPTTAGNANAAARYDVTIAKTGEGPAVYPGVTAQELTFDDLGNGAYTVTVQAIAASGLRGGTATHTFTVDIDQLPVATITAPTENGLVSTKANNNKLAITGTYTDDISVNYLTLQLAGSAGSVAIDTVHPGIGTVGGPFTHNMAVPANLADGTYELIYTPSDYNPTTGGQFGTQGKVTFKIDNTAPTTPTITAPGANTWHKTAPITNSWTAATDTNGIANYQVAYRYHDDHSFGGSTCPGEQIGGKNVYCRDTSGTSRSHSPAITEQGGVTIWVRAIDNAGNASSWSASRTYYYDATDPTTDINVSSVANQKFTVSGAAADNVSLNRVYVQLVHRETSTRYGGTTINLIGEGENANWSVEYNTASLPEGTYAAHVSVVDRAGNTGSAGWTSNFFVDKTAPVIAITSHVRNANGSYTISGTSDSNDEVSVTVDGKTYTVTPASDGTWSITTDPLSDGNYFATATSADSAGNQGSSASYAFTASTPVVILPPTVINPVVNQPAASPLADNGDDADTEEASAPFIAQLFTPGATDVLGAQDPESDADVNAPLDTDKGVLGTTAQPTVANASGFMGLAWYWWLLILAALIGLWWLIAARRRRKDNDQ